MACGTHGDSAATVMPIFARSRHRLEAMRIGSHGCTAGHFCIASGAWTSTILQQLGIHIELTPVRGQIVLFSRPALPLHRILNEGPNYLVPRNDGRVLVGSTVEEVGFDDETTEEGITELVDFAHDVIPELNHDAVERTWAGLRPKSGDGFPYLGAIPKIDNVSVVSGHYRNGILLAPGTARLMAQLIRGEQPSIDLTPFRPDRE